MTFHLQPPQIVTPEGETVDKTERAPRTPHYEAPGVTLYHDDCLDVLREIPDESVHAVVTDPPYGLSNTDPGHVAEAITHWTTGDRAFLPSAGGGFMGKAWDEFVPPPAVWDECMRVLKPGGHLLAFAGSRTVDLMALSIRLAGFDIRDSIAWLYGSGFPKSLDVAKAIDQRGGLPHLAAEIGVAIRAAREARGWSASRADQAFCGGSTNWTWFEGRNGEHHIPTPDVFARIAAEWPELSSWAEQVAKAEREVVGQRMTGRGTGKGAVSYISDSGNRDVTVASTDAARRWEGWGTALKPAFEPIVVARKPLAGTVAATVLMHGTGALNIDASRVTDLGRWPANVVLDDSQAAELDRQAPDTGGSGRASGPSLTGATAASAAYGARKGVDSTPFYGDQGGASRMFPTFRYEAKAPQSERPVVDGVAHPTVKPLELMQWLVRLVTPKGGIVLEPFAGSGTTVEACLREGFEVIAIEREADYLPLIEKRIRKDHAQGLDFDWGDAS